MHLISALYGVIFKNSEEAAFSNYRLWESMGFLIAYLLQTKVVRSRITGLGTRVVLRLLDSRLLTPSVRTAGREFTQPRDHSFAHPCICLCKIKASEQTLHSTGLRECEAVDTRPLSGHGDGRLRYAGSVATPPESGG